MLGFDDYPDIAARLRSIVAGETHHPHTPQDRRRLLPISPGRPRRHRVSACPGHAAVPTPSSASARPRPAPAPYAAASTAARWRRSSWPAAATGAARSARSRASAARSSAAGPSDVLAEARWLADAGRRASCSWSARTPRPTARTSATCGCSRRCCPSWPPSTASSGCGSPTSSPPRPGPGLIEAIATTPGVAPYFDLSFQHASADGAAPDAPLRRPRELPRPARADPRRWRPQAGVRSNVIVGFPGETEDDLETLCDFLVAARMDVTGVFGYSDEDGTEAASYDGKLDEDEVRARAEHVTALVEELTAQRAEERIGEDVDVLVESRRRRRASSRAGPPTRAPRSTAPPRSSRCRPAPRVGDLVRRRGRRHRGRRPGRARADRRRAR